MNITKRQLKKIIKEELQVVLNEVYRPEGEGYEAARRAAGVEGYGRGITADDLLGDPGLHPRYRRFDAPERGPGGYTYIGPEPRTHDEYLDEEDAYLEYVMAEIDAELAAEAAGGRVKGTGGIGYPRPSDYWQTDEDARGTDPGAPSAMSPLPARV